MYEREMKDYLRRAEPYLRCEKAQRETFRQYILASAQDFLTEQPEASFQELEAALGTPEKAAAIFMETLAPEEPHRYEKRQRHHRWLWAAGIAVVIVLLAAMVIYYYVVRGIFVVETTIVYDNVGILLASLFFS